MLHLLTMTCTIAHRDADGGADSYNQPTYEWDEEEDVRCLYLSVADNIVAEMEGRGVAVTGALYVMAPVTIEAGYRVTDIVHAMTGETIETGNLEVVRVKTELAPAGAHHKVAYLKRADECR